MLQSPTVDAALPDTTGTRALSNCLETHDVDTCRMRATVEDGTEPSRREVEAIRDRLEPVPTPEVQ